MTVLILTRRKGESVSIGPDVEITVLDVGDDHVRIGITAPRQVLVLRSELRREIERENRVAAAGLGGLGARLAKRLRGPYQGARGEGTVAGGRE